VKDYLAEIKAESPVQGAKYVFDAWILPELGAIQIEQLAADASTGGATSWRPSQARAQ